MEEMREFFDLFDNTGEGKVTNEDIEKVMNTLGEFPTPERIMEMVREIDYDSDGLVDFQEFTCLMVKQMKDVDDSEEELVQVFKQFDKNGDGMIDSEDLL